MWKKGPLPAGTYNWGGIVRHCDIVTSEVDGKKTIKGFMIASFCGDHAMIESIRVEPREIAIYNNCLELPKVEDFPGI